jgi:hypothetical protein
MMFFNTMKIAILVCGVFFVFVNESHAQQLREEERLLALQVDDRVPTDFMSEGITLGGFMLVPKLSLQGAYDSNVLASQNNEKSDYSYAVSPSVTLQKRSGGSTFLFGGRANIERYLSETDENSIGYNAFARGRVERNSRWSFPFSVGYMSTPRERTQPLTNLAADERLSVETLNANLGVMRRFNRLSLTLLGEYTDISNENGHALVDGSPVIYDDNDRVRAGGKVKLRYEMPRSSDKAEHILFADFLYAENSYDRRRYSNGNYNGPLGDHQELGFLAGFETTYKGLLFANIGGGMINKYFDDNALNDISTYDFSADISYNLSPKTTLNFLAARSIDQDSGFTQGIATSSYVGGLDYELFHNFYAGASLGYTEYDFENSTRIDEAIKTSAYLRYLHNRGLESGIELRQENRSSTDAGQEFDRLELLFRLTGKM